MQYLPVLLRLASVVLVNGWTDAPNAIVTPVASGVLSFRTAATLAALTVITLSGCVWEPDNPNEGTGLHYEEFTTEDGRRIPCAVYKGYSSGGLSCDWEHPMEGKETK